MIILHSHLQPQFIYELFHINFTSEQDVFDTELGQATGSYIERGNFNDRMFEKNYNKYL